MARQLDCDLVDMMYILDEPSIGLHPRDINQMIKMLDKLKQKGNSVFVIEHDPAVIRCADHIIDIGPEAGSLGGEIVFLGNYEGLTKSYLTISKDTIQINEIKKHNCRIPE